MNAITVTDLSRRFGDFVAVDRLTPGHLWNEILQEKNSAIAVLMGCLGIGISIIIAASIH